MKVPVLTDGFLFTEEDEHYDEKSHPASEATCIGCLVSHTPLVSLILYEAEYSRSCSLASSPFERQGSLSPGR